MHDLYCDVAYGNDARIPQRDRVSFPVLNWATLGFPALAADTALSRGSRQEKERR